MLAASRFRVSTSAAEVAWAVEYMVVRVDMHGRRMVVLSDRRGSDIAKVKEIVREKRQCRHE